MPLVDSKCTSFSLACFSQLLDFPLGLLSVLYPMIVWFESPCVALCSERNSIYPKAIMMSLFPNF